VARRESRPHKGTAKGESEDGRAARSKNSTTKKSKARLNINGREIEENGRQPLREERRDIFLARIEKGRGRKVGGGDVWLNDDAKKTETLYKDGRGERFEKLENGRGIFRN